MFIPLKKQNMKRVLSRGIMIMAASATVLTSFAGNSDRAGQAGATELLINPWSRSSGMAGANAASIRGLEAQYLNVAGMAFTLAVYLFLRKNSGIEKSLLTRIFAAVAVTCYYWYRLPELIGFGIFPGDGMLVDLSGQLPNYLPFILQGAALLFFSWWLLWKPTPQTSWTIRPPFANRRKRL